MSCQTDTQADGGTGEFSGDGRKLQGASALIELIGRWKKKNTVEKWRRDANTKGRTLRIRHSSELDGEHPQHNTDHASQIQDTGIEFISPCARETDVLYLGRSGNMMRSEEVSCNTPTILLQWILPAREICNSDTHTACVCVWWRLYKQYSFPTCETPVSPLHRRRKGDRGRTEDQEYTVTRTNPGQHTKTLHLHLGALNAKGSSGSVWWWDLQYMTIQLSIIMEETAFLLRSYPVGSGKTMPTCWSCTHLFLNPNDIEGFPFKL